MPTREPLNSISEVEEMAKRRGQKLGELIKRSGQWGVRYYQDESDPVTGERKRVRKVKWLASYEGPNAIGKREVNRDYRIPFMQTVDQFAIRPSSSRTLAEFIKIRFQPDVMDQLERNTFLYYRSTFNHILPDLGHLPLRDITPSEVQRVINKAAARKLTKTVINIQRVLSAVFNHAKGMEWYAGELPTAAVRLPRMSAKEKRAMTWAQVVTLVKALPEPCATLVVFLVLTGLRIGEATGLRWKWVNLTPEMKVTDGQVIPPYSIAVRQAFVRGKYKAVKTAKSNRNVPIPEWFVPRLAALEGQHAKNSDGLTLHGQISVFANTARLAPIDEHNLAARVLKPVATSLEMPWVSWHVLRHTHATLADQAGFSVTERQRILGHSSESMTLMYTHADLERMRPRLETMVEPKMLQ